MNSNDDARLSRSRDDLAAARHLAAGGFTAQAVSRAYFAALHAATEALLALGETRSKHSGVISAFGARLVREGQVAEETGRLLRWLFERRNEADYESVSVDVALAERAIADAEQFVGAVAAWLEGRGPGRG